MRPPAILSLEVPVPCLIRPDKGLPVNRDALKKIPPPLHVALGKILDAPGADELLLGLNEVFGGATEYAITGSTAIAVHHLMQGSRGFRKPGDLDLVVSSSGMDRLGELDHDGLGKLGFKCPPGNTESIYWLGHPAGPLKVDVIAAGKSIAGRGLENSLAVLGTKVVKLDTLMGNLQKRYEEVPQDRQIKGDLLAVQTLKKPVCDAA